MKPEMQFKQWEGRVFGAGYGSGELPIMKAIKTFFDSLEDRRSYNFQVLEAKMGDTVTWLLINALDKGNQIEWGTSARFGWITSCGENVRDFIADKSAEELYEILMSDENNDYCECDGTMKEKGHEYCGKNPMVNKKYADELKYKTK
jgi:hypothetical protein